jgi:Holliday junction resolvase RusA-like endonuclease
MINEITFFACGPIVGKQRPRFRRVKAKGKEFISAYTPKKTKTYEDLVAEAYRRANSAMAFPEGALEMEVDFYFKMPESWSNKKKAEMYGKPCTKRPDLDNCIKSVQDGLNGVAFSDDSQITDIGQCHKRWATKECTAITIRKVLAKRS